MYSSRDAQVTKEESLEYDANFHEADNHKEHPDPFLFADSKILTGQGKAVVLAVGESTYAARNRSKQSLVLPEQQTQLERKLEGIAEQIGKYAVAAMVISVLTHLLHFVLVVLFTTERELFSSASLLEVAKIVIVAVVLLIVAIPEGLPLAVSIAMAMSIESLKKDEILIKNIESIQTCAMLHDICVSKTGTLTKGKLSVKKYHICDNEAVHRDGMGPDDYDDESKDFFVKHLDIAQEIKQIIMESVISNTDVRIEIRDEKAYDEEHREYVDPKFRPVGQPLEVGLIQFLLDNGEDINQAFINRNRFAPKTTQLPFDQGLKRKVVIRPVQGDNEVVRVYVKGAPEEVTKLCKATLDASG